MLWNAMYQPHYSSINPSLIPFNIPLTYTGAVTPPPIINSTPQIQTNIPQIQPITNPTNPVATTTPLSSYSPYTLLVTNNENNTKTNPSNDQQNNMFNTILFHMYLNSKSSNEYLMNKMVELKDVQDLILQNLFKMYNIDSDAVSDTDDIDDIDMTTGNNVNISNQPISSNLANPSNSNIPSFNALNKPILNTMANTLAKSLPNVTKSNRTRKSKTQPQGTTQCTPQNPPIDMSIEVIYTANSTDTTIKFTYTSLKNFEEYKTKLCKYFDVNYTRLSGKTKVNSNDLKQIDLNDNVPLEGLFTDLNTSTLVSVNEILYMKNILKDYREHLKKFIKSI